jgi:hypothetical protein
MTQNTSTAATFGQMWSAAVGDPSGATFTRTVDRDVTLEGSVFPQPILGRDAVFAAMRAASSIYDSLAFLREAYSEGHAYLEWEAVALQQEIQGVTVLTLSPERLVVRVAIHHRPLPAVLAFSTEIASRLGAT